MPHSFLPLNFPESRGTGVFEAGRYKSHCQQNYQEEIWAKPECLLKVASPAAGEKWSRFIKGTVAFDNLTRVSDPFTFILSDAVMHRIPLALQRDNKEDMVFFNVKDVDGYLSIRQRTGRKNISRMPQDISDHYFLYDAREEDLTKSRGTLHIFRQGRDDGGQSGTSSGLEICACLQSSYKGRLCR